MYVSWLKTFMIVMGLFQTFLAPIWEICSWKFERFTKNALIRSVFELEKCFFFKRVRISPEIDWYHYQGASPAPLCIVWYMKKCNPTTPKEKKIKNITNLRTLNEKIHPKVKLIPLYWSLVLMCNMRVILNNWTSSGAKQYSCFVITFIWLHLFCF